MGRRLLIVLLMCLAALWLQGCGGGGAGNTGGPAPTGNSPQQSITGLSSAIQNGDLSGALAYVGKTAQDKIGSALQIMDASARLRLAIAVLGSTKVSESESRIVYKGTIVLPDGRKIEETFEIVKEEGIWKFISL